MAVLALLILISAVALLLWYCSVVILDSPYYDDWTYLDRIRLFSSGQIGLKILLGPINGHTMLFDHLMLHLDRQFASLDFRIIRWTTLAFLVALAAAVVLRLYCDLRDEYPQSRLSSGMALMLCVPSGVVVVSLTQFEIFSVAANVDLSPAIFLATLAVFLLDFWRSSGRRGFLVGALVAAVLTSLTQLHGMLVWPAMAFLLIVDERRRGYLGWIVTLAAAFTIVAAFNWSRVPRVGLMSPIDAFSHPLDLLAGNLLLAGANYLGFIDNRPYIVGLIVFGIAAWAFTALAAVVYISRPAEVRPRFDKYAALALFGIGTALMIEIGRLSIGSVAASRYGTDVLLWVVGISAMLALASPGSRLAASGFAALAGILSVGLAVSDAEEIGMAGFRRDFHAQIIANLRDPANVTDEALKKVLGLDDRWLDLAADRNFLAENRLSVFRDQPAGTP